MLKGESKLICASVLFSDKLEIMPATIGNNRFRLSSHIRHKPRRYGATRSRRSDSETLPKTSHGNENPFSSSLPTFLSFEVSKDESETVIRHEKDPILISRSKTPVKPSKSQTRHAI